MSSHVSNLHPLLIGSNDVDLGVDIEARDQRLDRMWDAHRKIATGIAPRPGIRIPGRGVSQGGRAR